MSEFKLCYACYQLIVNCTKIPGIRFRLSLASGLWSDDQSSIAIALNPVLYNRTKKHMIAIKYQYVNECVQNGSVVIDFVRSKNKYSDIYVY